MSTGFNHDRNPKVDLSGYRAEGYSPGAGMAQRSLWYCLNALLFNSPLLPFSKPKRALLRVFGAKIGEGVVIKPRVNIKHPWRLTLGNHCWIGEGVWIDNLVAVSIGANSCISQEAYLVTGNHDYKDAGFGLIVKKIEIEAEAWIGARAVVCAGVRIGRGAVVTAGSVVQSDAEPFGIYRGNPARFVRERVIRNAPAP